MAANIIDNEYRKILHTAVVHAVYLASDIWLYFSLVIIFTII